MDTALKDSFLQLVKLGIGTSKEAKLPGQLDFHALKIAAEEQGLTAIILDGIDAMQDLNCSSVQDSLPLEMKLEWIGEVLQGESTYKLHREVATDMANLYHNNLIRTYVLKGMVVAECYPRPNHRVSADMDCYLKPESGTFDAWDLGNSLVERRGFKVEKIHYKNSTFYLPGLTVENHQFLTPFRANERLVSLEKVLQTMLKQDKGEDIIDGTWLYRPPIMVSALFLIEHAYSHFLHEGLTWRMVLDWVMFSKKHKFEINWSDFDAYIDEFGFRKFYDVFSRLGQYLIGEVQEVQYSKSSSLSKFERMMLDDIWAPLDLHETVRGWRGKLALAGNTWRARWKYRYFTDISWIQALWIQAKGVLFEKAPTLD